jgi:hypothetical protein
VRPEAPPIEGCQRIDGQRLGTASAEIEEGHDDVADSRYGLGSQRHCRACAPNGHLLHPKRSDRPRRAAQVIRDGRPRSLGLQAASAEGPARDLP